MWDKKRKLTNNIPVIEGILIHHSAGGKCNGYSADQIFSSLNSVGFDRGYKPYGYDFKTGISKEWGKNYHTHQSQISYCEYHYAIYEYAHEEYSMISLIDYPEWTDAGSVFKREVNAVSVAFVFCGDYEANEIPESMVEYFIKLFRKGAPCEWILNKNQNIWIKGHKDTGDATVCPGKYLYTYIPRIEREIKA